MEEPVLTKKERKELAKEEKKDEVEKKENFKKIKKLLVWFFTAGIVALIGFKVYSFMTTPTPEVAGDAVEILDNDWVRGDKNAKAILIEYSDFQCPACLNYFPFVEKLNQEVTSDLAFVYRHFPLPQHKNAMPAAKAAEAAGKQGKFWEMYKVLFEKYDDWVEESDIKQKFSSYAEELGLNKDQFLADYDNPETEDAVKADITSGYSLGINSTPTFFLNGKKIQPRSYETFKKLVEDEIRGYTSD